MEFVVYGNIYKNLEHELASKRAEMEEIIMKSKSANEEMAVAKQKLNELEEEAEKESAEFEKE